MTTMNVERLLYLADWLAAGAPHKGKVKGFNISVGVQATSGDTPACGTVCCIAGAATQFFNDEEGYLVDQAFSEIRYGDTGEAPWDEVFEEAQELLGLTHDQATALFVPVGTDRPGSIYGYGGDWDDFNDPFLAAKVVRNLAATGEVNWDIEEENA